jgi:hypothetical protein
MCTVTWRPTVGGYELFFNRDELRARAPARPPSEARAEGVRYLAPTDTEAGGSWLAVNELGTTVGLLNAHPPAAPAPRRLLSRGLLVRKLADLASAEELERRLSELDLERLRPFTVFAVSPGVPGLAVEWDGRGLDPRRPGAPFLLSSSSIDSAGAADARRRLLGRFLRDHSSPTTAHLELHRSHLPDRGPLAPCMHREDARTVSFTQIEVSAAAVRAAYAGGPPCKTATAEAVELRLGAAASLRRAE